MSEVELNINNYDTYIRVREPFRESAGSSTYDATDLLDLANQAWGVNQGDDPTIPNKMRSLAAQVYQAIPNDDAAKRKIEAEDGSQNYKSKLDQYLAATAEVSRSTGFRARSGINVENLPKLIRWGIFAYGSLNNNSGNLTQNDNEIKLAGFASVYMTDDIKPEDIKGYNYEALLSKAESLLGEPNTDLEKVVKLLVFAIKGTDYPRGLTEVREVFDTNAINKMMLERYPGFNDDSSHKARSMIEQAAKLLITAGDNTRLSWTSGLTVAAASKLSERDNNRLLNIDDIHSSAVNIPANTGNWQPGARTDFSAAQASNVWQKYNRARDLLDSLPNGLLPSANTYRTEITAKKNAVLQGFTAEASKYTDTNKSQEYDWLEAGRTFVANLSSSDRSYTLPVGYTTRDFERKLETLRREAAAYYDSVGLNYLDNLDTLTQTTKIDDLLSQLERLKNSAHKDLFDRYYAGNLPNQTTANLKSTLTAAERVLNITGVPPNATVSQRWEKILTIKKEALATAEIESARLTDAALASLRDAQTKLNEAADIYENNTVNLPDMATPTRTAATASGTAIDNFSDSTAKAALDAAEAAARATGVNIQTIQTNSNLSLSQKTAAIADLIKADAEKRQKESLEASEKTRQEAEQNRENNITTLLTAQDNLNKALIIYNELKLGDLLADTEAQQRLRSLPEATTEARDAAGAAADRESYTEKFSDNLGIALRETEEAARAAGIQTPSDYSNKSPLEKVTYNAEQLLADAQARKEAQDKTGQQRGIAEAALSRAKAALTDITQDPQDTVDAEASTAKNAAEEAQRQAERAGTKAAAENAAAAQTASAETAGLDKEIKERRNRQARIAALGDAVKTAQDGYTKISPAAASKPKQDALNAIQSAVDAQDPAEIVAVVRRGLSRRPSVWQDADDVDDVDTQTALRKILQASDQSDLEKAEALLQIIKADAAGLSNNNSGMDGFLGT